MARQASRGLILALALAGAKTALAGTISIQLQAFPTEAVADGRSSIAVTLIVRNSDGSNVPDGTQVLVSSTLGSFRQNIVQTTSGIARAVLVAGNIPGTAKITASLVQNQSSPSTLEVELVSDRSKLSSANDYIDISSSGSLEYTYAKRIVTASGKNHGVRFEFRDRLLVADDLQYIYDAQVVRAKNASLKFGKKTINFSELFLDLRTQTGYGITEVDYFPIDRIRYGLHQFFFERYIPLDDKYEPSTKSRRIATVVVTRNGMELPKEKVPDDVFDFNKIRIGIIPVKEDEVKLERDEDYETVRITAKRMTVVSRREIQFQHATFYVGESKVFSQPLYRLDTLGMRDEFPTEQFVSFNNNQIAVNYPYYFSLERQQSRAIRFTTGQSYGRSFTANRGVFFTYEQTWNRANGDGNFQYSGIGRDDFDLGVRQFLKFDDNTTASFAIDSPRAKSLISTGTYSHYQPGLQTSVTGTAQRSLDGTHDNDRQDYYLVLEKDPVKMGKLPWNLFYGLNATYSQSVTGSGNGVGARLRFLSHPFFVDRSHATVTAGLTFSQYSGTNVATPFATTANVSYAKSFGTRFTSVLTYDYARDGVTERAIGLHRLSSQLNYYDRKFYSSIFAAQSLGLDRLSFFADASYRIADLWRVGYQYTLNRYSGSSYIDYDIVLAYRLSTNKPEFGFMFSQQTKRVGFVVLGMSAN
ncbi:MAG: hypothetical protein JST51_07745 [Armatimonadetes bacterium]|nr:hypothetical protein [Armatimonadota bacterium]